MGGSTDRRGAVALLVGDTCWGFAGDIRAAVTTDAAALDTTRATLTTFAAAVVLVVVVVAAPDEVPGGSASGGSTPALAPLGGTLAAVDGLSVLTAGPAVPLSAAMASAVATAAWLLSTNLSSPGKRANIRLRCMRCCQARSASACVE